MSLLWLNPFIADQEAMMCDLEASTVCQELPPSERDVASLLPRAHSYCRWEDRQAYQSYKVLNEVYDRGWHMFLSQDIGRAALQVGVVCGQGWVWAGVNQEENGREGASSRAVSGFRIQREENMTAHRTTSWKISYNRKSWSIPCLLSISTNFISSFLAYWFSAHLFLTIFFFLTVSSVSVILLPFFSFPQ